MLYASLRGNHLHPILDGVVGGWRVAAVHHYQGGTPLGVTCGQNLFGAGAARCDYVPGQPLYNPSWDPKNPNSPYLNKSAFVQPANGRRAAPARFAELSKQSKENAAAKRKVAGVVAEVRLL